MTRFRRCVWLVGLMLLLPRAAGPAQAQAPEEGWQVYTNANYVNDLALEGGGALGGGYTWVATDGGVVCFSADQQAKFTTADGLADNWVEAITVDSGGRLWFGMQDSGVSVLDHGGTPFDKGDDTWITFTTADGLASNYVYAIAVDGGRRLWFGTGGGVSVLDYGGTPFYKGDDTWATLTTADGLADNSVYAITTDGGNRLWFGTWGGVSVLDDGGTPFYKGDDTWTTFTSADGLADNAVLAIAVDSGGRLWFGTDGGGVSVLEDGGTPFDKGDDTWKTFTTADGLANNRVYAIAVDGRQRLWFGTSRGVSVLDYGGTPFDKQGDTWITFTSADGLASNYAKAIAVDSRGRLWFGTSYGGVSVLDYGDTPFDRQGDTWTTFTSADGLASNYVEAIAVDSRGRLWFGTSGGVSVLDDDGTPFDKQDDTWTTFTSADGLTDNQVTAIAVDSRGQLWFDTAPLESSGHGVNVLDNGGTPFDKGDDTWATFTTADGLADNSVYAITTDGGNRLWFGTNGGVSVLDYGGTPFYKGDDTWATFTTADGLADNYVRAIAVDGGNRLWFATGGGVSVLDHGGTPFDKGDDTWTTFTTADGLAYDYVEAIAVDSGERLWFGTWGGGVSVLDDGGTPFDKDDDTWTTFTTADGLANNDVGAIAVDSGNRLWFGSPLDGKVSVLNHGGTPVAKGDDTWIIFTESDGLANDFVYDIAVDRRGRLWFDTGNGVSVLDHGGTPFDKGDDTWTTFTTTDGLTGNTVYAIAVGRSGRLWFGTYDGVSELVDAIAPTSSACSPTYASGKISVPWSASDGASHIFRVTLWVKHSSSGAWISTGLSQRGQVTGTFTYTPTYGDGTYSFATVAEDWMGNIEAAPAGRGDCSACVGRCYVYLPVVLRYYHTWDTYYEENDHWLAAYGPLVSGKAYLAYPDDVEDYYYFMLSATATVNVSVTDFAPTSSNGTVMLYGPAVGSERGNLIDYYGPPGDSSMPLGPHSLGPGKYYVRVNTAKGHSTTQLYRLTVTY